MKFAMSHQQALPVLLALICLTESMLDKITLANITLDIQFHRLGDLVQ